MGIIYKITHKETSKCYIGQTVCSLHDRLHSKGWGHFTNAFVRMHRSPLYNALRKYGKNAFTYEIIEEIDDTVARSQIDTNTTYLSYREMHWIKHYDSFCNGYNQTKGGEGFKGMHSAITRAKVSEGLKKYFSDSANRDKLSRAVKKSMHKPEINIKMREGLKRKWQDKEFKHKMSIIRSKQMTDENKARILQSRINNNTLKPTQATKQKMSAAHKGKHFTDEHKRNISKAAKHRQYTKEGLDKIRLARQGYKYVTNKKVNKRIKLECLDEFLAHNVDFVVGCTHCTKLVKDGEKEASDLLTSK